jgi:hypothetical protein
MGTQLVMYEEESGRIEAVCQRLTKDANAKVVFLIDKAGQLLSAAGQTQNIDSTSLASLTAGNVAAMGGLAKLLGENEFPNQFHEGAKDSVYMTLVGGGAGGDLRQSNQPGFGATAYKKGLRGAGKDFRRYEQEDGRSVGLPLRRDLRRRHRQPL